MSRRANFVLATGLLLLAIPANANDWHCDDASCQWPRLTPRAEARRQAAQQVGFNSYASGQMSVVRRGHGARRFSTLPVLRRGGFGLLPGFGAYVEGGSANVYVDQGAAVPYWPVDPIWQFCQFSGRAPITPAPYCGPFSYYPFGVYGHRPLGTYQPYEPAPLVVTVPSARVIHLRSR